MLRELRAGSITRAHGGGRDGILRVNAPYGLSYSAFIRTAHVPMHAFKRYTETSISLYREERRIYPITATPKSRAIVTLMS